MTTSTTNPTVAVAVDGSTANQAALQWAISHADRSDAALVAVAIAEPYEVLGGYIPETPPTEYLRPVVQDALAKARETLPEDRTRHLLETGHPVSVLQQVAADHDMLVVGKRGMGAIGRLLIGSTSIAVAGRAHAPVVVVPVGWEPTAHAEGPVVVGVDTDKDHEAGLRFAFRAAQARGVSVRAVQVWEPHPVLAGDASTFLNAFDDWVKQSRTEFEARMEKMAEEFEGVKVQVVQVVGQPVHHLLEEASDAQLLVLGRDPKDRLSGFALGSVARGVLHHSDIPVAVIPAD